MPRKTDVLCQVKQGAIVSAYLINGIPAGVIVTNNGGPPMLYRFDGTSEALAVTSEGRIVLSVEIEPGASFDHRQIAEHYEIACADLISPNAPSSETVN
jgi:hypothetical protein